MSVVTFRNGTRADDLTAYHIFQRAVSDLELRNGLSQRTPEEDQVEAEQNWPRQQSLFEHLGETAEHFVLAEVDGETIGYARSILRDNVRELTEFFVLPGRQSGGVGRALLERVFPKGDAAYRVIIATTDPRALARYLKAGVYARFPVYNFSRVPRPLPIMPGLKAAHLTGSLADIEALAAIDRAILGYTRPEDHTWWMQTRTGFLYEYQGQRIGYGYSGYDGGPVALLDETYFPAVLAHAETSASQTADRFHLEIPLINQAAVDYLLGQDYEMSTFTTLFMSDKPFGRCENYILPSPPFSL